MLTEPRPTTDVEEQSEANLRKIHRSVWFRTRSRRFAVEGVLFLLLVIGGGLLTWGGTFAHNMVHDQLSEQQIQFPAKGTAALDPKEYPGLQRYAGQMVDNGPKAKAYANQFIGKHLQGVAGGLTYSQVSSKAQANPNDAKLQSQRTTLFQGETLRGLLLYAWGWSVIGTIAIYTAFGAFVGAAVVAIAMIWSLVRPENA